MFHQCLLTGPSSSYALEQCPLTTTQNITSFLGKQSLLFSFLRSSVPYSLKYFNCHAFGEKLFFFSLSCNIPLLTERLLGQLTQWLLLWAFSKQCHLLPFCFQWNYRVLSSLCNNGAQLPCQGSWTDSIPTSQASVLMQLSLKLSIQALAASLYWFILAWQKNEKEL